MSAVTVVASRHGDVARLILAPSTSLDSRILRTKLEAAARGVRDVNSSPLVLCTAFDVEAISEELMASVVCDAALGTIRDGARPEGPIDSMSRIQIAALAAVSRNAASIVLLDEFYEPGVALGDNVARFVPDVQAERGIRRLAVDVRA